MAQVDVRPEAPETGDELEALIKEARRRARRRRLGYFAGVAAGALVVGAFLLFGGGGDGSSPADSGFGPQSSPAIPGSHSAAGNPCRDLSAPVRFVRSVGGYRTAVQLGHTVAGCEFQFDAVLPDGWYQGHTRTTVFPPEIPGLLAPVEYSNSPALGGETRPFSMSPGRIAIDIDPEFAATRRNLAEIQAVALRPTNFRHVNNRRHTDFAHSRLVFGGWRFQATVYLGRGHKRDQLIGQANDLLNSIHTTERQCPCT